jgi:hypothetical protein
VFKILVDILAFIAAAKLRLPLVLIILVVVILSLAIKICKDIDLRDWPGGIQSQATTPRLLYYQWFVGMQTTKHHKTRL